MKNYWLKLPKWLRITIPTFIVLFLIVFFGVGWYFSNMLLHVTPQKIDYDQTVSKVDNGQYSFTGSAYDVDGIMGAIHEGNVPAGIFSAPLSKDDKTETSVRTVSQATGTPPKVGEKVSLQGNIWTTNPKQALGIDYQTVHYDGPVGTLDAWLMPVADSHVWTIAVHGIGASKLEMLRFIKPVQASGSTMMIIGYRGDAGNPASPDGYTHLGDTEWQDVQAAVRYARAHGATSIQFYSTSLGGSLTENYLRRSADVPSAHITKVVLDSPALNWNQILTNKLHNMGYPSIILVPGKFVASLRSGVSFNRITTHPGQITVKTLIVHNPDDTTIPQAGSVAVAKAQPNLVTFVSFGSGGHIRAWNHDPAKYEKLVTDFLQN